MLNILRKIISTGTVTENWDTALPAPRFRGEVVANSSASCQDCQKCAAVCPTKAIRVIPGSISIDQKACVFCGLCVENCEAACCKQTDNYKLATLGAGLADEAASEFKRKIRSLLGRSLHVRHVDVGSCNACDFEMNHLCNPIYDIQQYGVDFVPSPRHADLLMVTGVVTRNSTQALQMTYDATPHPKLVMAVGACAASGQIFGESYAIRGAVDRIIPVDIYVPGCPPRPQALIHGLLLALDRLK
ncbi:NADH-quinone oxidoreductase subunit NuoB [Sporomusa sp. KB1]|jgi:Ni,Fe-hydrogenase III small subunit/Pyruvate/2-oxoacid:ferredoxin oxidoreductase delta subunit|uniref:NADH-quinone oxidoreductase subunit NuoB n=1 Tax=Sporomusa sp. KB1 TaxID=943346 RepID=UPI0011A04184|nr:NADH-quinone oxidoreductase subunit NuoB [Sporomusa sp. KB1]TWH46501.1 Ni,Fe-hydrogenase III small subunit [Sporomusa sp. KB1]